MLSQHVFSALAELESRCRRELPNQPSKVLLFGSFARGDFNQDSDVDLLVLWDTVSADDKDRLHQIIFETEKKYNFDFLISLIEWDKSDYLERKKLGSLFLDTIEKEGEILWAHT